MKVLAVNGSLMVDKGNTADGMPGSRKTIIDRMLPMAEPIYEIRDDRFRHPLREGCKRNKKGKGVLVSNCGYWEMDNFDPLLHITNKNGGLL